MMMQLNPPIPVDTPRGPAYAHMVIDYSQEHYVLFVVFLADTGECWVVPNRDVKLQKNLTMGVRVAPSMTPPDPAASRAAFLHPQPNGNGAVSHE